MNLLRWTIFPGSFAHPCDSGSGGGDGGAGALAQADESRKTALRTRIDKLYGISDNQVPIYGPSDAKYFTTAPDPNNPGSMGDEGGAGSPGGVIRTAYTGPVVRGKGSSPLSAVFGSPDTFTTPEGAPLQIDGSPAPIVGYQDDPEATAAKASMDAEDKSVSDATRGYYTDQLARSFGVAERNNRFRLARQGLQGGSEDVDSNANLQTDQNLGSTRIDEAARRAAASLDAEREQERVGAIQLVNSGAGESAVNSASAGLRNALNTANSASKADLFSDLFASSANSYSNLVAQQAAAGSLAQFQKSLGTFFPTGTTTSGRVTPNG